MDETVRLADFVSSTGYGDLPPEVVEATKVYVLDNLASGLVGSVTPWAGMVKELARENGAEGLCSIIGSRERTSPPYAALVNGTAIAGFETDHAFFPGSSHPGAAVFPAALAVAERDHLSGRAFLTAVALGYEVICRVGEAATRAVEDVAGFHGPGTNGPIGAAAGVGKALGLSPAELVNALGIAGSHACGLMEFVKEGAMTKRLHLGRSAQTGLESALLAAKGFTGPSTVLEGDRGFLNVYSPSPKPQRLTEALGQRFVMLEVSCKSFPCHMAFHPVIEGVVQAKAEHKIDPARVEQVHVSGAPRLLERHGQQTPTTILGAQYSLPFSLAMALAGDVKDPLTYHMGILGNSEVRRLSGIVEISADVERFGRDGGPTAEVTIVVAGEVHRFEVTDWKGASTNPFTFDEMFDKFSRYARPYLARASIREIGRRVRGLEREADIADLARLLRRE